MLNFNKIKTNLVAVCLLLVLSPFAQAMEIPAGILKLQSSKITFHVSYFSKNVVGISFGAKGKGVCKETCSFIVAVPAKSFDSQDANRDLNMLLAIKAKDYPLIAARIETKREVANNGFVADIKIKFAGKEKIYKDIKFNLAKNDKNQYQVKIQIPLILSDFAIERPSLLFVKINDSVPVTIESVWKFN